MISYSVQFKVYKIRKCNRRMVSLRFVSDITDEELLLKVKYDQLKDKKKVLDNQRKSKPEPLHQSNVQDTRELAKKLVKLGIITAQKHPEKQFKRPLVMKRKLSNIDEKASSDKLIAKTEFNEEKLYVKRSKIQDLYNQFTVATNTNQNISEKSLSLLERDTPKGNTIYVSGMQISESFLRKYFSSFGTILNIAMEDNKNGFITFDKPRSAERALNEMDGYITCSTVISVSMLKREPILHSTQNINSGILWSSLATSYTDKITYKENRQIKIYDDDSF